MTGLPVFFAAMFLLNITPGPDMLYVLARATGQGLAGLLRTVPAAYTALRLAGAAYLIYLGVRTLLARGPAGKIVAVSPASLTRLARTVKLGLIVDCSGTVVDLIVALAAGSHSGPARRPVSDVGLGIRLAARDA
jgi:threonine/homoserine/homoserine lactone efflux protein